MITAATVLTLATMWSSHIATAVGIAAKDGDGKRIYNARCSICHGIDGRGNTASGKKTKARDLTAPEVQSQSDAGLKETVMYGVGKMPAFEKKLTAENIQQVLAYIRELGQKG